MNSQTAEDRQLVRDCIRGNAGAQYRLYNTYAGYMMALCSRYTKCRADAEDILQEGFVKVFKNIDKYKGDGSLGAWIRKIMINTAIDYLKKNNKYQVSLFYPENEVMHPVSNDNPGVNIAAEELTKMIMQLPEGYQLIFNLYAVDGYSHAEIGKMLGIQEVTSRSQYARARKLLISWLRKTEEEIKAEKYGQ